MDLANILIHKLAAPGKIKNASFQLRYFDFYQFGFIHNYFKLRVYEFCTYSRFRVPLPLDAFGMIGSCKL